ncbi:MAG: hypothetical protein NZ769_00820, partial [Anaerolineae bacterium]|nr:hypothetical protein [Anaerolineae bacterium]
MDALKRSLEELFTDFVPPTPEGVPPTPEVPTLTPESVPSAPVEESPKGPVQTSYWRDFALSERGKTPGAPVVGAHVRNIRAQLLGNVL